MWYKWLIFAAIFLAIPFGVGSFSVWAKKQLKVRLTVEQERAANLKLGLLMLFYWLCDLFYMAFILDSLTLKFIFGGLIMLIIFYNLSKAFISGAPHFKWGLIQDFVVGVGMSIYLIYIIPNADLKAIVIPVISAVYGGLITLVGVAWTIRHSIAERKRLEKERATPYLQAKSVKPAMQDAIKEIELGESYFLIKRQSIISNVGLEPCFFKGVISRGVFIECAPAVLAPNDWILLKLNFELPEETSGELKLVVCDRLLNYYSFSTTLYGDYISAIGIPEKIDIGELK